MENRSTFSLSGLCQTPNAVLCTNPVLNSCTPWESPFDTTLLCLQDYVVVTMHTDNPSKKIV